MGRNTGHESKKSNSARGSAANQSNPSRAQSTTSRRAVQGSAFSSDGQCHRHTAKLHPCVGHDGGMYIACGETVCACAGPGQQGRVCEFAHTPSHNEVAHLGGGSYTHAWVYDQSASALDHAAGPVSGGLTAWDNHGNAAAHSAWPHDGDGNVHGGAVPFEFPAASAHTASASGTQDWGVSGQSRLERDAAHVGARFYGVDLPPLPADPFEGWDDGEEHLQ
ncbi:hypothetical protein GGR56DRAFT_649394 [Xylariaceae sp. FL0804]|nr:hypothetical protein GGR56DRAFT_649394 [Xylariaceae sp. FL0804]